MCRLVPEVTQAQGPVFANLFLETEIPLLHICVFQVQRLVVVDPILWKRDVGLQHDRKWIPAGVVLPWIRQRGIRERYLAAVR